MDNAIIKSDAVEGVLREVAQITVAYNQLIITLKNGSVIGIHLDKVDTITIN